LALWKKKKREEEGQGEKAKEHFMYTQEMNLSFVIPIIAKSFTANVPNTCHRD
jgi:hypothetical protein